MSSAYINFQVLGKQGVELVNAIDCSPVDRNEIFVATILPIRRCGAGWAKQRLGMFHVKGEIDGLAARLNVFENRQQIAGVAVALSSTVVPHAWDWLHARESECEHPVPPYTPPPNVPWVALRCDVHPLDLPVWFRSWTKNLGYTLLSLHGSNTTEGQDNNRRRHVVEQ